jgi:glycerophosphoryl diester phosphodiesterase
MNKITAMMNPPNPPQRLVVPETIAHRGVRDRYPENTLPAFAAALDEGADAIEIDVHATRDGVLVVHHDPLLPAKSSGPLAGRAIAGITAAEIAAFELASGVTAPTLEEVLQAVGGRARVYIEIKAPNIEADLIGAVRRSSAPDACALHSFDHRMILNVSRLAPEIETGILIVGYPVDAVALLTAAGARDLWQSYEFIDAALVSEVHLAGGRVIAWTCNDPHQWEHLTDIGVDAICTDRIGALVSRLRGD